MTEEERKLKYRIQLYKERLDSMNDQEERAKKIDEDEEYERETKQKKSKIRRKSKRGRICTLLILVLCFYK
jgi:hypothetical protein